MKPTTKILPVIISSLLLSINLFAQAPQGIPYQAIARNASGVILSNQSISLRFSIHDATANGTVVYREIHSATTNTLGLFTVSIGQGTAVTGTFAGINWGSGSKFTQVELDATGGSNYINLGTQQMMSVPYALFAEHSNDPGPAGPPGPPGPAGSTGTIGPSHFIGESYGGGIVFYVYNNGQSGLIAAPADQSSGTRWYGGSNTNTCARANGVGAGLKNTAIIIGNQGPVDGNTFAARLCNEYSVTVGSVTYGDWYLPSKYELNLLYLQRNAVGGFSTASPYWSSTESSDIRAWYQSFFDGFQADHFKNVAYSIRAIRAFYGNEVHIQTPASLSTTAASSISITTASSGGNITGDGGATVTVRGVCWSTNPAPTTALSTKTTDGTGTGTFTSSISGLTGNTTYYVRAYATNSVGTSYGNEISFTTLPPTVGTLSTTAISSLTGTTATSGGNITSDGGTAVTIRGVCWNTSSAPTTALSTKTTDGTGTGSYSSSITGLSGGTVYFVRAYATNSAGTAYGNEVSFTTPSPAILSTTSPSSITSSTATSGGNISGDGGAPVTIRGVCWSTNPAPTTALNTKTTDGTGTGTFTSTITGLTGNSTYYVRAYATNIAGTSYGNEVSFTTLPPMPATLTTNATSSITGTTATSGGNITDDGGTSVTARGVCWSSSPNPTTANSTTTDGTGTGSFSSSITGLTAGNTYYVRAYATNGLGTYYGNEVSFTTGNGIVLLSTAATCANAQSGGNITSDGGDPVTVRGVCWSTSPGPTTGGNKTIDGVGSGSYSSNITGLTANTTYYVRAYATNSVNTYYGNEISFTTASVIYSIGQSFGGGIIFYIDCSGVHGLISASSDQSTGVRWNNGTLVTTGATGSAVGTGQSNTTTIVTVQGAGTYAASICDNLSLGGQTDWFLPSRDELHLLYQNRVVIGGFTNANYWSSTEDDDFFAWIESFFSNGGGSQGHFNKANAAPRVRAIRAF